jgi:ABC-type hemin transport system ATPase subunit
MAGRLEKREHSMDLNYLFHRQQIERSRADGAASEVARKIHEELAAQYERQIVALSEGKVSFSDGPER